jgi:integrase
MSVYYNEAKGRWHWQFKARIDGIQHRLSKLLPTGWSEAQADRYDQQETARTYARLTSGQRASTVPLIDMAVKLYLDERVPELRDGKNGAANLAHLYDWYHDKGLDQLGVISRGYRKTKGSELSPATIRQRLATLRSAASYALKSHGLGKREWIEQMSMPSVSNERRVYLSRAEVLRLCRAIKEPTTRAWVLLTFATGSRPGELQRSAVLDDGARFAKRLKNDEFALKPVPLKYRRYTRHWPLTHNYTWYSRIFREAAKSLGYTDLRPHDLRHSTASALMTSGATLVQIGKVLNHKTAQATNRYTHLDEEEKMRLLGRMVSQKRPNLKRSAA